jgi:hypothetical protein
MSHSIAAIIIELPLRAAPRIKERLPGFQAESSFYIVGINARNIVDRITPISNIGDLIGRISEIRPISIFPTLDPV